MLNSWDTIIGIETHIQLSTKSKLFSNCSTKVCLYPNKQICNYDIGVPGVLPIFNQTAIEMAVSFGLVTTTQIYNKTIFERKNYFYPDLPKGYQLSQKKKPILGPGKITIKNKTIYIDHVNLEEDAGKLIHYKKYSIIDFNRSGMPLFEIITKPCILTYIDVIRYVKYVQQVVKYINVSNADLSKGELRCDINISIRNKITKQINNYIEVKNLNSYKYIKGAILYETKRQINILNSGGKVVKETRLYNFQTNKTYTLRKKENTNDYLFLICPDLLAINIKNNLIVNQKKNLPELPHSKIELFVQIGFSFKEAKIFTTTLDLAKFVEITLNICKDVQLTSVWIRCYLFEKFKLYYLNTIQNPIKPKVLGKIISYIKTNIITVNIAKIIFNKLWTTNITNIEQEINEIKKEQINDKNLLTILNLTFQENVLQIKLYKKCNVQKKKKLLNFIIGRIVKNSNNKANPKQIKSLIKKII
ncbi:Asp-tRNA(Asn)/Glu-tRNA(Gln) amidotransferase subunit GatB [Candidatus Portiera aleyrodidarum]|uniref:Aspartyl/glutamyl-tRNA(Asn/Gln) amidotransferase subunit B n=1 Tax=Candidatus Portiera aleyrodidarum MED (Bemisia tabaci) TaxID=1163752 RepID=A0AAU8RQW0_9GAMM|nr:Asp-tRNA(Asn)/Glu-tRNA(Gln) amidotransferase subunit GatB [Candidatus Portiera aleyrodidarum]AFQ24203.1 glutamyl-tRNA(Gln) and/or aspartyl-tRNA(Asn) amidotransferase, B subunit [Candidatus Portiera aleyrodidarum BT-B-HRs]AFS18960.1 Aspartyl/glutamyl-tRNA(Asn/Gln) amidotransferase subunit B [Candidatus Portiera aleyrodidarum BT-QVLC]AFT80615.1 Aspartyl-tRNA [Candidatus Portiera aleyrodidarum BT-QVLC]AFT80892.1 Aspartyl-tRNA [Candidatus Portiera aleyrodidarum BT-B-HRs]AJF24181.1 glutamyl-tRNA